MGGLTSPGLSNLRLVLRTGLSPLSLVGSTVSSVEITAPAIFAASRSLSMSYCSVSERKDVAWMDSLMLDSLRRSPN
ncbi:MAG: hypothetical protein H6826_11645 [Planctomycetes bacterium]|nr:hypothetical protein [Planctomycetota bacterium]